jgi:uncharacterized protein
MQKIETLDALRGISNGTTITVADNSGSSQQQVFEKIADGLRREGFTLTFEDFAGEVTAGRVWQGVRVANGQMWRRNGYHYYVYRAFARGEGKEHIVVRLFETGEFYEVLQLHDSRAERHMGRLSSETPEWFTPNFRGILEQMGSLWTGNQTQADRHTAAAESYNTRINDLATRVTTLEAEKREHKAAVESGLIQFATDHDLIDSPLGDLMEGWGMRRPFRSETVTVTAYVEGSHYRPIPDAASLLPFETTSAAITSSVQVNWSREMTFDRTVAEGECACSLIDYDAVREAMQAEGSWEHVYSVDHRRVCTSSGHPQGNDGTPRRI